MSPRRRGRGHGAGGVGNPAGHDSLLAAMGNAELFTADDAEPGPGDGALANGHRRDEAGVAYGAGPTADETHPEGRPRRAKNRNRGVNRAQQGVAVAAPAEQNGHSAPEADVADTEPMPAADGSRASCTMAQMRRFIKSRPYVPIHELRRRFEIEGYEDDVNPVPTDKGIIYVGLPPQEAHFLSDLIKAGEVGCEMLMDPCSPAVVGVFAMRPVARQ